MSDLRDVAKEVYRWSSKQTAENSEFKEDEYFWTEPVNRALLRLANSQSILLGITGLQGTGKSAALTAIQEKLSTPGCKNSIRYKWKKDWENRFLNWEIPNEPSYHRKIWEQLLAEYPKEIQNRLHTNPDDVRYILQQIGQQEWDYRIEENAEKKEKIGRMIEKEWEQLDQIADERTVEKIIGEKGVQSVKRQLLAKFMAQVRYVFIDLPDYTKNDVRAMNKDIDELQHMWMKFTQMAYNKTSFVIAIQKEIAMKRPHFFFGKLSLIEILPLTPQQLLDAYRLKWKTIEPFNEDALLLIAKLSRGVFRRFLKYINLTLETTLMNKREFPVTSKYVEDSVSFDVLLSDMELELADVFTQQTHKIQATKILQLLRGQALTQKQIAEKLNMTESMLTKIIGKLELYGYVKRNRGEGKTWLVSLP
jgi:biotin operon repressor